MLRLFATWCWQLEVPELSMPITWPNKGNNRTGGRKMKQKKRKEETDAIHELEGKRKRLKTDVSSLLSTSKEMYEKCEKSGELSLVMKANSLRRRAEEKQQEVVVLDREIACLFMF